MSNEIQYTEVEVSDYKIDMLTWCNENIGGYGRVVSPSFYFHSGYSWYARRCIGDNSKIIFSFARPEDATLFTLRWS